MCMVTLLFGLRLLLLILHDLDLRLKFGSLSVMDDYFYYKIREKDKGIEYGEYRVWQLNLN